jgi:predicted MFS family arabinose efflux permease
LGIGRSAAARPCRCRADRCDGAGVGDGAAPARRDLVRTTFFAALLATGVQGGYYTLATWLPTYLKKSSGLDVVGTGGHLFLLIGGAFLGYVTGGILTDKLGRKRTMQLFAFLSVVFMMGYIQVPEGANTLVLALGFAIRAPRRRGIDSAMG